MEYVHEFAGTDYLVEQLLRETAVKQAWQADMPAEIYDAWEGMHTGYLRATRVNTIERQKGTYHPEPVVDEVSWGSDEPLAFISLLGRVAGRALRPLFIRWR